MTIACNSLVPHAYFMDCLEQITFQVNLRSGRGVNLNGSFRV